MPSQKSDWRSSVREQMWQAAHAEAQRDAAPMEAFAFYRWEHVMAVVRTAILLAESMGADAEIAEAAAWLHDIRKEMGPEHGKAGAEFAREFLPNTDFPESKIEAVALAIENHIGLWRETPLEDLNSQVLWDADKLTKLGLEGGLHFVLGEANKQAPLKTEDVIRRLASARKWRERSVESMHTPPARRLARKRLDALDAMLQALESEVGVSAENFR